MPIFLLLLHFFFYQYHIFLFQNNIQTFNHAKQKQTKNNQIFVLLTKLTILSLRITVRNQIDRAAFHQVIKNLAPFLPSLLDDASRVSQQSVSPQFCNSVLSLHRPLQDATSEAVFLLPFFFFFYPRRNNFNKGFAPIYAVSGTAASLARPFRNAAQYYVDSRNYTKKEELFISHVYRGQTFSRLIQQ